MALALPKRVTPEPVEELRVNGATLRFYLGDCVELLRAMEPGTVSAMVTSPPYNLGVRRGHGFCLRMAKGPVALFFLYTLR